MTPMPPNRSAVFASRFGPVWIFLLVFLALQGLVRTVLLIDSWRQLTPTVGMIARVYGSGGGADLVTALYAIGPFALYALLVPDRIWRSAAHRVFLHALWIVAVFVLLFAAVAEWVFWAEFASRFNFIAVDYLVYTREVVRNIWEPSPSPVLLGAIALGSLLVWLPLRHTLSAAFATPSRLRERLAPGLILVALPILAFFRIDAANAGISKNRYANQLAENGLYDLFAAFRHNQIDYEPFYVAHDLDESFRRLRGLLAEPHVRFTSDAPRSLEREVVREGEEHRKNVVLIVVESLSASFMASFGNDRELTPRLDALAKDGLFFTQLYATGTRTVRGLEAVSLSVPPTPGNSIVRRPKNGGLFNIGTPFRERGYDVTFFYGGYGFFDNMNAFFAANGFDIVDRASFSSDEITFENAWGVADEDLYRGVLRSAGRSYDAGRPFFSFVMTTSNHRPFTYPEDRVPIPSGTGRYGAIQYTDWAIADFLESAKQQPWFSNTVFVIVADHTAKALGRTEIPVSLYHIPMIIYAPGFVAPGTVDRITSQMDVAPTLLGLLNFDYKTKFYGRDALAQPPGPERALLSTFELLGFLEDGWLTVLAPGQRVETFAVDLSTGEQKRIPAAAQGEGVPARVAADAIAYYQTASWAFQHGGLRGPDDPAKVARGDEDSEALGSD
jgi:phosphoglycerol transferase MdoB-like AlkP superfamily enzyme